jgi:hypothetical protein
MPLHIPRSRRLPHTMMCRFHTLEQFQDTLERLMRLENSGNKQKTTYIYAHEARSSLTNEYIQDLPT